MSTAVCFFPVHQYKTYSHNIHVVFSPTSIGGITQLQRKESNASDSDSKMINKSQVFHLKGAIDLEKRAFKNGHHQHDYGCSSRTAMAT